MEAINETRLRVWARRSRRKKKVALLDLDGTIAEVCGECKEGMDISYNGKWGYGQLVVSLANSREVLYVVNRPASRPSHEGAPEWIDKAVAWTKRAGFRKARLRGDTDFSLTAHFDRWTEAGVEFVFGMDARFPCASCMPVGHSAKPVLPRDGSHLILGKLRGVNGEFT